MFIEQRKGERTVHVACGNPAYEHSHKSQRMKLVISDCGYGEVEGDDTTYTEVNLDATQVAMIVNIARDIGIATVAQGVTGPYVTGSARSKAAQS